MESGKSWEDANINCAKLGGHLATVNSQEVNDRLQELLKERNTMHAWIGYSDIDDEGEWVWSNPTAENKNSVSSSCLLIFSAYDFDISRGKLILRGAVGNLAFSATFWDFFLKSVQDFLE